MNRISGDGIHTKYSGITECKVQAFIQNRGQNVMKYIHKEFRGNSECKEMAE
jgi:hypothetical protein